MNAPKFLCFSHMMHQLGKIGGDGYGEKSSLNNVICAYASVAANLIFVGYSSLQILFLSKYFCVP